MSPYGINFREYAVKNIDGIAEGSGKLQLPSSH
jgi:hypothetical protein